MQNLSEIIDYCSHPVAGKDESNVVWAISLMIKSQAPLSRLISVNHGVDVSLTQSKQTAVICLSTNDRHFVPNRDFVLLFRDEMVNKPSGLIKVGAGGDQAISI